MAGLRTNIGVSLQYLAAWIGGAGAVAINSLMEDAATVEISRMQIWQWVHHQATTEDGTPVTAELVRGLLDEEVSRLAEQADERGQTLLAAARDVFETTAWSRIGRSSSPATPTTPTWWRRPDRGWGLGRT